MKNNNLIKALCKGKEIFINPKYLYSYEEIINGVNVHGKNMKAVANNTFMAFGYPLNENAKKVKKVYEDYFIENKNKIIESLKNVDSLEDMDILEKTIYCDIYKRLLNINAEKLDSYNRVRKPINLYLEHIIGMCNLLTIQDRIKIVPHMFLPMDKFIFSSKYIFNEEERRKWNIKSNLGFGQVKTEELFYEMQNTLLKKAECISNELGNEFYRIYFDMFWRNRLNSTGMNLFLTNLDKIEHKSIKEESKVLESKNIIEKLSKKEKLYTNNKNRAQRYTPKEFEETDIFQSYSNFCKDTIRKLNAKIPEKYNNYFICTRNGSDTKITFKEFNYQDKNILTFYPNKRCNHAKVEIREGMAEPYYKIIKCDEDIDEVLLKI